MENEIKVKIDTVADVIDRMCQSYCKWPVVWDSDEELSESSVCKGCPLKRLVKCNDKG